jgi:3-oxoadipate CoA-transferase alpha subunit
VTSKQVVPVTEAVDDDESMIMIDALIDTGATNLTVINNNEGNGTMGLAGFLAKKRVKKVVFSSPRQFDSQVVDRFYRAGEIDLEPVPQSNLALRIRAAGAGIGAFYTPTGIGTILAEGKETRTIDGLRYILENPQFADFALVKAYKADRLGNLVYRKTARNFGPIMTTATTTTIVQVKTLAEAAGLDPASDMTPGILVDLGVRVGSRFELKEWADVR